MGYVIAVDVGTSRTAAAVARVRSDGEISTTPFALGRHADSVPSSVFALSGELLWGDAAERRGITQPERLIREFTRRVGDDVPIIAGDQSFTAEQLFARMVTWVVDTVREREGHSPDAVAVTVPVTWGGYRTALIEGALARAGLGDVVIVSEPEAAARRYETLNPLAPAHALAVYDFGGGTFDAVILRKDADGTVQPAGDPHGIRDLGGVDFDDAVLRHVITVAGLSAATLAADRGARMGLAALRRECVEAKEALSFDSEVSIPVLLGDRETTVRLTRDEFEAMIEDAIGRTAETLADALESADVTSDRIDAILLTGGSSRIPRVAQHLSARFDLPIATDVDPKAIIALGAAGAVAAERAGIAAARLAARSDGPGTDADAEPTDEGALDTASAAAVVAAAPRPVRTSRSWFHRMGAGTLSGTGVVALAATMITLSASALGGAPIDHALGGVAGAERAGLTLPWAWESAQAQALPTSDPAAAAPLAPVPPSAEQTPSARRAPGRALPSRPVPPASPAARTASRADSPAAAVSPARPAPTPHPPAVVAPGTATPVDPQPTTAPAPTTDPAPAPDPQPAPADPEPTTDPEPQPAPTADPQPAPADPAPEQSAPHDGSHDHDHGDGRRDGGGRGGGGGHGGDRGERSDQNPSESQT